MSSGSSPAAEQKSSSLLPPPPTPKEETKKKAPEVKVESKTAPIPKEKRCLILRVKRQKSEKPADTLVLEEVSGIHGKNKRLRVLPPEDYLEEKLGSLKIAGKAGTKGLAKHLFFQRITDLDEETKKAQAVNVDIEGNECSLFKFDEKKDESIKEKRLGTLELPGGKTVVDRTEKALEEQEKAGKLKRNELFNERRKKALQQYHSGTVRKLIPLR